MNHKYLIAAFGALTAALAACGTTNNITQSKCGAGTRLQGDTCVSDLPDSGIAADTGIAEDAGSDVGVDSGVEPDLPDEPCPVGNSNTEVFNCDPKCGPMTDEVKCRAAACKGVDAPPQQPGGFRQLDWKLSQYPAFPVVKTNVIVRLPRDPWLTFAVCDPNRAISSGGTPYVVRSPQPKFYFVFGIENLPFTPGTTDLLRDGQVKCDSRSYTSGIYNFLREVVPKQQLLVIDKAFPLPVAEGPETAGCKLHRTAAYCPSCGNLGGEQHQTIGLAIMTSALSVPAQNIRFDFSPGVQCTGNP